MYNKGITNFKLADYINNSEIDGFSKSQLYSIIINRWYYGLFLMGKGKLNISGQIHHTDYQDKKGLWVTLASKYPEHANSFLQGITLFSQRVKGDYYANSSIEDEKIFKKACQLSKDIKNVFDTI